MNFISLHKVVFIIVLSAIIGTSCEVPKMAADGKDDEIILFADSLTWVSLERTLKEVFEDTVFTPIPETWYRLRWVRFDQFKRFEKHKNRIIVGTLDGEGDVARYVQNSLAPEVRTTVEAGEEFFFVKYNTNARAQITMFLAGTTIPSLDASLRHRAADLLYYFKNMSLRRELASIESESQYHKKKIESSLADRYGWTMTIQHDYWVAIDSAEGRFFWVRRANPADMERWIWVHWIDTDNQAILTDKFAITLRDMLTKQFLRTIDDDAYVEIAPYNLEIQSVNFLGRFAYETRGNWRFSDKSGGGPFVNYTFYDEETRRIYMLDGSIFAPRVEKKKLILQVDGLLHTFRAVQRTDQSRNTTTSP
jgi:hypothetical protein